MARKRRSPGEGGISRRKDGRWEATYVDALRHTMATLMLKAGVSPKVVQERLGHSTISMTLNVYAHVLTNMQREATDKLRDILRGEKQA